MRQLDLQLLQIIRQMRRQWLRIRPVNDFARHLCDNAITFGGVWFVADKELGADDQQISGVWKYV